MTSWHEDEGGQLCDWPPWRGEVRRQADGTVSDGRRVVPRMSLDEATRIVRQAMRDKSYRAYPLGGEAGQYLRWKRKMITKRSYLSIESCLDKLARDFTDLELIDFEPPVGQERLEEWLEDRWGDRAPRTYNANLSYTKDFFRWAVSKGKLHGDPAANIKPAKPRAVHREYFSSDAIEAMIASQDSLRDKIAVRLLLHYGIRKGGLRNIQFKHFDHNRKRLTVFTKGESIHTIPIPEPAFWDDLGRHLIDVEAEPDHYLMCRRGVAFAGYDRVTGESKKRWWVHPHEPMGDHGLHDWWYQCQEKAGLVAKGTTSGSKMHKARYSAGQQIVERTGGNLLAAKETLGHADISTTEEHYVNWNEDLLRATLSSVWVEDDA